MCLCRYILLGDVDILLNCNLSDVYAIRSELIYGLGYSNLTSKGSLRTGEALREKVYKKIFSNNIHIRAPMLNT